MADRAAAGALLLAQLAAIGWFLKGDLASWRAFRALADTGARQRRYWRWCVKDLLVFALPPMIGLALLGRLDALATLPAALRPAQALLPSVGPAALREMAASGGLGLLGGTVLGALISRLRRSRKTFGTLGDVGALLPRNRGELGAAAVLSVSAGVTEELAFRLFLPLTLALVTGSAVFAMAASALIFGAVHLYQGWVGVVATTVVGLLLSAVYLMTGMLWIAMAIHTLIDLNGLVLRPVLTGAWRA